MVLLSIQNQVLAVCAIGASLYVVSLVARSLRFIVTTSFLMLPLLVVLYILNSKLLWIWIALVNSVTTGAYAADKIMSTREQGHRVSEKVLLGLSLAGGYPSAFVSQRMFRHKSSKSSFQWKFWVVVGVVNSLLVFVYLVPS